MPQLGSSCIMLSLGQYEVLQSYGDSREFSVSIQQVLSQLLGREHSMFQVTPRVERALGFVDWLADNHEHTLTVKDEVFKKVDKGSEALQEEAWKFYQHGGGKRKRLPTFYRHGFFSLSLLGHRYVVEWAESHPRFLEYLKMRVGQAGPRASRSRSNNNNGFDVS